MKTEHQKRVEYFMSKIGHNVPKTPTVPPYEVRLLRARLIFEECLETIEALGFTIADKEGVLIVSPINIDMEDTIDNLIEIADGCADISVVTIGTLSACGIHDADLLREIDESNLRKFGPGAHRREDGKWIKPPDWEPPNIKKVLIFQEK